MLFLTPNQQRQSSKGKKYTETMTANLNFPGNVTGEKSEIKFFSDKVTGEATGFSEGWVWGGRLSSFPV